MSRILLSEPLTAIFCMEFWPILTFFIGCGHIFIPSGMFWVSTCRPHIGDLVMSLFLLWGPPSKTQNCFAKDLHWTSSSLRSEWLWTPDPPKKCFFQKMWPFGDLSCPSVIMVPVLESPPRACQPIFMFARSLQNRVFRGKFRIHWFDGLPFRISTTYMVGSLTNIG